MKERLSTRDAQAILLDIEGTTTPITFVYDVLFPFARANLRHYLDENLELPEVRGDVELLHREQSRETDPDVPSFSIASRPEKLESTIRYVQWLMDRDRKSTALKSLQGRIWRRGYAGGLLRAQVFPDVPTALERWHASGVTIAIFSSGSVLAQKLLFAHTECGDLTRFIKAYFDTRTGAKTSPESYSKIATALALRPADVVFVSDVVSELDGAQKAGMNTVLCVRPGNHPQPQAHNHPIIHSFDGL